MAIIVGVACGVVLSLGLWRRGSAVIPLLPITAACALGVLIGYGILGPPDNPARGHRQLARQLDGQLPTAAGPLYFFHEIDEGLWFYLGLHRLVPVPGSQPHYSDSFDLVSSLHTTRLPFSAADPAAFRLLDQQKLGLLDWLRIHGPEKPLMLVRTPLYDRMAPDLADLITPLIQETGLKRNCLTLVQVRDLERPAPAPR